ncbi:hypothetical protein J0H58_31650, partial [bacterium]|nr:hypothetical protein [bacterium]
MRRLLWAGVVVLAFPAVAAADAAIVYRPGDSGYARAKLATQVVHGAALCAVVTGVAWAANSYGRNRTAAFAVLGTFCFVMLVFWNGSRTVIATPDTPPAGEEVRPAPGAVSGEEVTLFAAIAAIVLAGYGVKVARRDAAAREREFRQRVPAHSPN